MSDMPDDGMQAGFDSARLFLYSWMYFLTVFLKEKADEESV